jgi:hypothetical protein
MFGLHPNAEIAYLASQGENLYFVILAYSGSGSVYMLTAKIRSLKK